MSFKAFAILALLALSACSAEQKWASDEAVAKATYVAEPPRSISCIIAKPSA